MNNLLKRKFSCKLGNISRDFGKKQPKFFSKYLHLQHSLLTDIAFDSSEGRKDI